jgi:hypothetical protein
MEEEKGREEELNHDGCGHSRQIGNVAFIGVDLALFPYSSGQQAHP